MAIVARSRSVSAVTARVREFIFLLILFNFFGTLEFFVFDLFS